MKPLLVGECNPVSPEPRYSLYPLPRGRAGHRLCHTILGLSADDYLTLFDRVNLCAGKWSGVVARHRAREVSLLTCRKVLLGSRVARAFGLAFEPFTITGDSLVLPHPSGLCRLWNEAGSVGRARAAVLRLLPELADKIGVQGWSRG